MLQAKNRRYLISAKNWKNNNERDNGLRNKADNMIHGLTKEQSRDILRHNVSLAYGMLRGSWMRFPRISDVWNKRTVTHCPNIGLIGNLQELVYE